MRQIVRDTFFEFTRKREGFTPFMYCDTLNLVTTGVGNLIDASARNSFDISDAAMAPAMNLPWRFKGPGWTFNNPIATGTAGRSDIQQAWIATKLKAQEVPGFNTRSSGFAYQNLTPLTLDMEGLQNLFNKTLNSFDGKLQSLYPSYEDWPADAQLAILSMSWAMGPSFWPALRPNQAAPVSPTNMPFFQAFKDAAVAEDFMTAKARCEFKGGGSVTDPKSRNFAHQIMFENAANVVKAGADRNQLFFPGTSVAPAGVSNLGIKPATKTALEALALTAGLSAAGYGLYSIIGNRSTKRKSRA